MIRAEVDRADEKIGKKIREALTHKVPVLLVVGQREEAEGTVTVRRYGEEEQESMGFDTFVEEVVEEIRLRARRN